MPEEWSRRVGDGGEALRRVPELAGLQMPEQKARLQVVEGDIRNPADLDRAFAAGTPPTGRIGEDPQGIPDALFPSISQVASGLGE